MSREPIGLVRGLSRIDPDKLGAGSKPWNPKRYPAASLVAFGALVVSAIVVTQIFMQRFTTAGHNGYITSHVQNIMNSEAQAARPPTVVKPISCKNLLDIPGKSVATVVVDFPPGAYSPAHRHPGSVTAYVLKGTIRSQLAGGPIGTYQPGGTWFEPPGALHLFAENASDIEPAELLAFFVTDENCGPLVIPEP